LRRQAQERRHSLGPVVVATTTQDGSHDRSVRKGSRAQPNR
jgi:hypothetical protein